MLDRRVLIAMPVLALCLFACGPSPDQVNNSGHEPYMKGDYGAALEVYQNAQVSAPENGEPYYNAGNALYRMEQYGEAVQEYDESLRYAYSELRLRGFFNRGNASFRSGQYAQAIEAYKEVLRMDPDHVDAKHNLELSLAQIPPPPQPEQEEQQPPQQEDQQPPQQEEQQPPPQDDQQPPPQDDQQPPEQEEQQPPQQDTQQPPPQEDRRPPPQTEPITVEQARQILETVGEDAMTLQERRRQVYVPSRPPSEFGW